MATLTVEEMRTLTSSGRIITRANGVSVVVSVAPQHANYTDHPLYRQAERDVSALIAAGQAERYMSVASCAAVLGLPYFTVLKWLRRGYIHANGQLGNKRRVDITDVAYCKLVVNSKGYTGDEQFLDDDNLPVAPSTKYASYTDHPLYRQAERDVAALIASGQAERYMSINSSAGLMGISQPTVLRWVRQGYIKEHERVGNKQLIDLVDVAYCKLVMDNRGRSGGAPLLDDEKLPYVAKKAA